FQAEDGIRDPLVTGVQTCALPIYSGVRGGECRGGYLMGRLLQHAVTWDRRAVSGVGDYRVSYRAAQRGPEDSRTAEHRAAHSRKIGRASCRESVWGGVSVE